MFTWNWRLNQISEVFFSTVFIFVTSGKFDVTSYSCTDFVSVVVVVIPFCFIWKINERCHLLVRFCFASFKVLFSPRLVLK